MNFGLNLKGHQYDSGFVAQLEHIMLHMWCVLLRATAMCLAVSAWTDNHSTKFRQCSAGAYSTFVKAKLIASHFRCTIPLRRFGTTLFRYSIPLFHYLSHYFIIYPTISLFIRVFQYSIPLFQYSIPLFALKSHYFTILYNPTNYSSSHHPGASVLLLTRITTISFNKSNIIARDNLIPRILTPSHSFRWHLDKSTVVHDGGLFVEGAM